MRKIREILRLALGEGLSRRATGAATGLPYTTVSDHLVRAAKAGLGWPLPDGMDDAPLEARLFARAEPPPSASRPLPDWPTVHRELRRKGMTLQLLHMEYKERQPDGYQYTQFCRHYRHCHRGSAAGA
jgi:transposase